MRYYTFLTEFVNPKNINYNEIDDMGRTNNPNYKQDHITETGFKEQILNSDNLLENFALLVTCCKYGDSILRSYDESVGMADVWYKCFSRSYYKYQQIAEKVARNYKNINNLTQIANIVKTEPYNLFINGAVNLINEYHKIRNKKPLDSGDVQYFESIQKFYMAFVKTYNELKAKFK